ncbi:hypothetical protein FOA52_007889 [Chlamydomonas sp. UWO 241]|nr:hypothetical protein FOA52_007889 [Chlamydomonas sp. UWO 241]
MGLPASAGGVRAPEEIVWDRIDKQKFFVIGVGAFSGVTTVLYPLTVIKTNQQLAHGAQTTAQTTQMIWRTRGLGGFYRGYTTVVFGTIPSRAVYMTALEATKSNVAKAGKSLGFSDTAVAGSSNFLAGGASSLCTQLITVPIDVVSQRQMVLRANQGGDVRAAALAQAHAAAAAPAPASSSSGGPARPAAAAGGSAPGGFAQHAPVAASAAAPPSPAAGVPPAGGAGSGPSSSGRGMSTAAFQAARRLHQGAVGERSGAVGERLPGAARVASLAHRPGAHRDGGRLTGVPQQQHSCGGGARMSTSASASGGGGALPIIRGIVRDEGVVGLYRGLGASIVTFVPSSAVWWGSYGLYQKIIWNALGPAGAATAGRLGAAAAGAAVAGTSSATGVPPTAAAAAAAAAGGAAHSASDASTSGVMVVQAAAACLAGCTSAGLTAPLDLIKTRIQVARKTEGQAATFRAVATEVLREDGVVGMWRAAGPRMASSALWGTAMVTVYEGLKRVSVKDEHKS